MADYGAVVSFPQAHASGNDEQRNPSSISASGGGSPHSESPATHQQISPENTGKRRRGRPQGSKNKPKPPIVVTRDGDSNSSPLMKTVVLEISPGSDVIERIISFACRNHPFSPSGTYELHSLIGSFFAEYGGTPSSSYGTPQSSSPSSPFRVTLQGPESLLFGGRVIGKLTAATQVVVVAAVLASPSFDNSPCEDDNEDPRRQKRARNVNIGATASYPSTAMHMGVYRVANPPLSPPPPPSNLQFSQHMTSWFWDPAQKMN
ncbi:hypothetical protein V6N13_000640 [Hibiscus sabdariffa]|uniref:AT-hook motif nuclear-localized protein n=1 Tax=Hibiscus sabdariffa TaxID=183260 RepID=A0ABR2G786_9ROSI